MGILDSVQSSLNRGVAGASRTASTLKLRSQLADAVKRRQSLAAQLGASLYEATRNDFAFRSGREALYDGIAAIDAERANIQGEIDQIEAEGRAAQAAAEHIVCPFCGARVGVSDMFCAGCGKPMAEITAALAARQPPVSAAAPAAPEGPTCPACGATAGEGDLFCMNCGHRFATGEPVAGSDGQPGDEPAGASDAAHVHGVPSENVEVHEEDAEPDPDIRFDSAESEAVSDEDLPDASAAQPASVSDDLAAPCDAPAMCPSCGCANKSADRFCMKCGTPLHS